MAARTPTQAPTDFDYRLIWRSRYPRPGHHASTMAGAGHEFRARAPLLDAPDPRRLALRASLADPFGRLFVNLFNQYSAIPVYALVDDSASMDFEGVTSKRELRHHFLASLAMSAYRTGDPFGLAVCGARIERPSFIPATRNAALIEDQLAHLRDRPPTAPDAAGLRRAAGMIGRHRALVFLVSDFHLPAELLNGLLGDLARHEVVPIVLRDSAEGLARAGNGLVRMRDAETGRARTLWMRAGLRARAAQAARDHRQWLERLLTGHQRRPFFLEDTVDRDRLNRYFAQ